mmetsp:Transcript_34174/g.75792  ORF Transcript_34174/g.75792 Transcript_34174/m.75792 type:complete len:117 (-) Transcript_34174:18-368(-)
MLRCMMGLPCGGLCVICQAHDGMNEEGSKPHISFIYAVPVVMDTALCFLQNWCSAACMEAAAFAMVSRLCFLGSCTVVFFYIFCKMQPATYSVLQWPDKAQPTQQSKHNHDMFHVL